MKIAAKSEAFEGCEKLSSVIWKTKKTSNRESLAYSRNHYVTDT